MSVNPNENQAQVQDQPKNNEKEYNLTQMRRQIDQERNARILAEERAAQLEKSINERSLSNDDDDSEPYVDHKKLDKKLAKFSEQNQKQTQNEIQKAVQNALSEERKSNWIKSNPDFYEILQHAEKFAQRDPDLAESILEMPDTFERQKLVYKNIKALGVHRPESKEPSIQEKVDQNKRNVFYQPSGVGSAPYASQGDFSESGKKNAYEKMQQLLNNGSNSRRH